VQLHVQRAYNFFAVRNRLGERGCGRNIHCEALRSEKINLCLVCMAADMVLVNGAFATASELLPMEDRTRNASSFKDYVVRRLQHQ
jgi:hypothetical protein